MRQNEVIFNSSLVFHTVILSVLQCLDLIRLKSRCRYEVTLSVFQPMDIQPTIVCLIWFVQTANNVSNGIKIRNSFPNVWEKSVTFDKYAFCEQTGFIFHHSPPCGPQISSIGAAVLFVKKKTKKKKTIINIRYSVSHLIFSLLSSSVQFGWF